jgi:outer membrane murein-binding lipoprotein Lpp
MRDFVIAIVLAVVVVSGSMLYSSHIDKVSREMAETNQKIEQSLREDDFEEAKKGVEQLSAYIDKKKFTLAATINHEMIDKIEIYLSELNQYIEGENKVDALARTDVLDVLLEHVPQNYKLKIENIL